MTPTDESQRIQNRLTKGSFVVASQYVFLLTILLPIQSSLAADRVNNDADSVNESELLVPKPISNRCGKCHGAETRKGDLDLSSLVGIRAGGESGDPLIDQEPLSGRLWQVIQDGEMPPENEAPLEKEEIEQIKSWIQANHARLREASSSEKPKSIHDVLPTLLLRCVSCHGAQRTDGGLDLRTHASIIKGGESGSALVKGRPDESLLIRRVESQACPPGHLLLKFFVRRPSKAEINLLRDWIKAGAPEGNVNPDIASDAPDPLVSESDRQHWAYQPPQKTTRYQSIDNFIEQQLHEINQTFSPRAERDTLIRRVYMNLLGLPPSLDQWLHWHDHPSPDWYSMMVDDVLASPHYGERWGRYWLDLAGYADSEGGISADPIRPVAWKYRDYVVRSFNQDKPYDQFLIEQLAGDELTDHANVQELQPEMIDHLIATGFLRMGIDETGSRTMNFVPERLKVISDTISIVSSGLMGLTMECARCHTHKYDPIPQRDYYRFKAIFQGALDEHDWKSFKQRKLSIGLDKDRKAIAATNPPLAKQRNQLLQQAKQQQDNLTMVTLRSHYPAQSEADQSATLVALKVADNQRTLPQRLLVEKLQRAQAIPDSEQISAVLEARLNLEKIEDQIQRVDRQMVPPLTIRALWDNGRPSPTYILKRGEHDKPGRLVGPGVPSVLTDGETPFSYSPPFPDGTAKTGRRLAFAQWLTSPQHPTTARVMVNRIWFHHFGQGLVSTLENFGVMGQKPTHPELLDWLAISFVENGWSIKTLHRLILNSRTYQQSSRVTPQAKKGDPQNKYYSRMPLRRLDAESIRDSLLFVSDQLDTTQGGLPDPVSVSSEGEVSIKPTDTSKWRRSLYAQYRRTEIPTMLDTFDYPQMGPNCLERSVSNVSPQSLLMLNNRQVRELAASLAHRVQSLLSEKTGKADDPTKNQHPEDQYNLLIDLTYQITLSRSPTLQEKTLGRETLKHLHNRLSGNLSLALESYCHAIMNSASFLYVD
ncbi:PSD1 and planctomycete cytochrome C domain-containing protein [bacterium]|nr:PSD1 and planctomycete cytochrome C domain-containing protein [bacterium]